MNDDGTDSNTESSTSQAPTEIVPSDGPIGRYLSWAQGQQPHWLYAVATIETIATHELARYGFYLRTREYPLSLWFALAGESASGKSTAIRQGREFIETVWTEASVAHATSPWIEAEGSVAGLLAVLTDLYDPHRQTTAAILFHHELSAVMQTREPIGEMLCRVSDGLTYERNLRELQRGKQGRAARTPDKVVNPRVSGLFASTEVALARVFNEAHRTGGLYSRFSWVKPAFTRDDARFRSDQPPDADPLYRAAVDEWTGWLATMSFVDREISLSPDAEAILRAFFEVQRSCLAEQGPMNGPRMRLVEKARVFAAVNAVGRRSSIVSESDMACACRLAGLLITEAEKLLHLGAEPLMRKVYNAQEMIERAGDVGISQRELMNRLGITSTTFAEVAQTLVKTGRAVEIKPRGSTVVRYLSATSEAGKRHLAHNEYLK